VTDWTPGKPGYPDQRPGSRWFEMTEERTEQLQARAERKAQANRDRIRKASEVKAIQAQINSSLDQFACLDCGAVKARAEMVEMVYSGQMGSEGGSGEWYCLRDCGA